MHAMRSSFAEILLFLTCTILSSLPGFAQGTSKHLSLIQLIATPDKFEGASVTVDGFLVMEGHRDLVATVLYLHKDDADNLLGANSVHVIPSEKMRQHEEQIDHMYVVLTGSFHTVRTANGSYTMEIRDVQSCTAWSNPSRPIGLQGDRSPQ